MSLSKLLSESLINRTTDARQSYAQPDDPNGEGWAEIVDALTSLKRRVKDGCNVRFRIVDRPSTPMKGPVALELDSLLPYDGLPIYAPQLVRLFQAVQNRSWAYPPAQEVQVYTTTDLRELLQGGRYNAIFKSLVGRNSYNSVVQYVQAIDAAAAHPYGLGLLPRDALTTYAWYQVFNGLRGALTGEDRETLTFGDVLNRLAAPYMGTSGWMP